MYKSNSDSDRKGLKILTFMLQIRRDQEQKKQMFGLDPCETVLSADLTDSG